MRMVVAGSRGRRLRHRAVLEDDDRALFPGLDAQLIEYLLRLPSDTRWRVRVGEVVILIRDEKNVAGNERSGCRQNDKRPVSRRTLVAVSSPRRARYWFPPLDVLLARSRGCKETASLLRLPW